MGRKKKSRRSNKMTLPLAVLLPVAAPVAEAVGIMAKGDVKGGIAFATAKFTGLQSDGTFNAAYLMNTYGPMAAGALIHWGAGRMGVNRALGKAKIPLIRI